LVTENQIKKDYLPVPEMKSTELPTTKIRNAGLADFQQKKVDVITTHKEKG
jgi:hypothetical protein